MANCIVSFATNTAAVSNTVYFEPLPNQIVDGVAITIGRVIATASGNTYSATLTRKAKYRLASPVLAFEKDIFTVPDSATANILDLIQEYRTG